MFILGLSDSHDASVTLIEDGVILAAVSEERFTRKKRQQGFPYRSLEYVKSLIKGREIERVYLCGKYGRALFRILDSLYSKGNTCKNVSSVSSRLAYWLENTIADTPFIKDVESKIGIAVVKSRLSKTGIKFSSFFVLEHHFSHIVSSLCGMPSDRHLVVSLDAYGDALSGAVLCFESGKIRILQKISYKNSIAQFYAYICAYLGFKEGDEGKVMALADFGSNSELYKFFKSFFKVNGTNIKVNLKYKGSFFLRQLCSYSKDDIAFALQRVTEEIVVEFISAFLKNCSNPDLFLAGGLFANIKVTQRLHERGCFNRIFVSPNMGDGGLSFASLINDKTVSDFNGIQSSANLFSVNKLRHVYLGPGYEDAYIESVLKTGNLSYRAYENIEKKAAELLSRGKVIARFHGRMEFGPRALGNRSILYQTTDRTVNDWLNKKLKRDEFMPFAPVTLYEFKDKCYLNVNGAENAAKFMTISFECTEWMQKVSPSVVHVDGTARPQLIKEDENPGYYKILRQYYEITGIPSVINTSFNMHGEPIVCSPYEAVRTFQSAGIDYLAIGSFLVENKFT